MPYIYGVLPPIISPRSFQGLEPVKPHITLLKISKPIVVKIRYRPFVINIGRPILLPNVSRPRYIALEVYPRGELAALRRLLEAILANYIIEKHGEFVPHLTLYSIRLKRPTEDELMPAIEYAKAYTGISFAVSSISLLDTSRGEYRIITNISLK